MCRGIVQGLLLGSTSNFANTDYSRKKLAAEQGLMQLLKTCVGHYRISPFAVN